MGAARNRKRNGKAIQVTDTQFIAFKLITKMLVKRHKNTKLAKINKMTWNNSRVKFSTRETKNRSTRHSVLYSFTFFKIDTDWHLK